MPATIREVAKAAGVAPITVSRVINNSGYIRPETRQKVQDAIQALGYIPNTLARSLRMKQTGILALILTDVTNPFWTTVSRGVEDAASDAGMSVILCNTDESTEEQDNYINLLIQRQVDGILLVPAADDPAPVDLIRRQKTPLILLDRRLTGLEVDSVRCDSHQGAYEITRHLLSLGHRQVALLSGPFGVSSAQERLNGYRQALQEVGLLNPLILEGEFTVESGYRMAKAAIDLTPRPTALFAGNNFIAIGALKALRDAGISIPGDISVAGFDDLPATLVVDPFLTSARQPAYEMGFQATRLLLNRLSGSAPDACQEIILPVELIVRASTGPVPTQS